MGNTEHKRVQAGGGIWEGRADFCSQTGWRGQLLGVGNKRSANAKTGGPGRGKVSRRPPGPGALKPAVHCPPPAAAASSTHAPGGRGAPHTSAAPTPAAGSVPHLLPGGARAGVAAAREPRSTLAQVV